MTNFSQRILSFIFSYSIEILLTLYIPDDEFSIRNRPYFTIILILQAFIYLFLYINYLFIYLYINKTQVNNG
jgi:hypothetical protein